MEDLTGMQLGPYRIVAPLGEGGMAAVYRAYQPGMDRYVAIKILPRQLAQDAQFLGRFQHEARLIAKLVHPHILPIHDFGEAEGYSYLVMPLIEGGTLKGLLTGRPLPLPQIISIITQLADALQHAHALGVVHRDLKPSNVLVDQHGNCLLTDFGIARMVEDATQFTQTGATVGTPAYMSPEQGRGEKVDFRSDLYSLGVMLYELATGRVPFDAETPIAIIFKHVQDPLPPPRTINPQLPEAVERVIFRAMAKDPADRFASAHELAQALRAGVDLAQGSLQTLPATGATLVSQAAAGQQPHTAVRAGGERRPAWPTGRAGASRMMLFVGGLVVLGLVLGGTGLAAYFSGALAQRATATPTPSLASQPAATPQPTARPQFTATPRRSATQSPPTVVFGSPTALPTSAVVGNAQVLFADEFDGPRLKGWQAGGGIDVAAKDGLLVLTGHNSRDGVLTLNAKLDEGQAALFLFQLDSGTQFEMQIDTGQWNQPSWRIWGINGDGVARFVPVVGQGRSGVGDVTTTGSLKAMAERWYVALFQVGGAQDFVTRIWERDDPSRSLEIRQAMSAEWAGLVWEVSLDIFSGHLGIDRYEQLALPAP